MSESLKLFLVAAAIAFPFSHAAGAELFFSPVSGSFSSGKDFSVDVRVDPKGGAVNAADATITFDADVLSVTGVSKGGTAFTLWTEEPDFSNTAGTVTFGGGSPSPISAKSTIITITFMAKAAGVTRVAVSEGSILAADGKGTDVYTDGTDGEYVIGEGAEGEKEEGEGGVPPASTAPPPRASSFLPAPPPEALEIVSATHKDSEAWYSTSTASFEWEVPFGVDAVRLLIAREDDRTPEVLYTPPIASRTIENLDDGEWYFYVQARNNAGWGDSSKKKILVDTAPPLPFGIALVEDETSPKLTFGTEDELSGIDRYEVSIGDAFQTTVTSDELEDGAFALPPQDGGLETVIVKAYDKAGNVEESAEDITLPFVAKPVVKAVAEEEEESPPLFTVERILALLFVFTTGVFATLYYMERSRAKKEHALLIKELADVREKSDKIFSALQEQIEEEIHALNKKPQLSPAERDLLHRLNEVLDISEELIDMEIDEIRSMLRKGQ